MSLQDGAVNIAGSSKAVMMTAGLATGSGASQMFGWIPDDIGKAASLAGILALLIPVFFAFKRWRSEQQKMELEQQKLQLEIEALKNGRPE